MLQCYNTPKSYFFLSFFSERLKWKKDTIRASKKSPDLESESGTNWNEYLNTSKCSFLLRELGTPWYISFVLLYISWNEVVKQNDFHGKKYNMAKF